jgi:hypothetical protein
MLDVTREGIRIVTSLAASARFIVFEGLAVANLDFAWLICLWLYIGLHSVENISTIKSVGDTSKGRGEKERKGGGGRRVVGGEGERRKGKV